MRVAYVLPRYAPDIGGVETHVERIAVRLAARVESVEVLTQTDRRDLPPVEKRAGVTIRRFHMPGPLVSMAVAPDLWWYLATEARGYDVVHAHNYHSPPALAAATLYRGPLVFTPHYHGTGHSPLRRWLHIPYRLPGAYIFRRASRIICVSEPERRLVERRFPSTARRTIVIPNGVDTGPLVATDPFPSDGTVRVLSVGRMENYKRMDRVVEAAAYLPPGFTLTVIGEGPVKPALERLTSTARGGGQVTLPGNVDGQTLRRWFRSADVYVLLSEHESFSITPREALAAGAPLVLSDIPAHREIVQEAPPGSVTLVRLDSSAAEIAAAIEHAANGERPDSYTPASWDDVADRTCRIYMEIAGNGARVRAGG